jgi:thiamine kinase-like enzyme
VGPDGPDPAEVAQRVPGWSGRARVVGTLDGGITNRNSLIDVDGERFVLRLAGKDTHLLEIDRTVERAANERAARLGFAPEVVAFVEPEGYLVTRFVTGESLDSGQLAEPATLARIADALRRFHGSGPLDGLFDAFEIPRRHLEAAVSRGIPVPDAYPAVAGVVGEIAASFAADPEPAVPCHNDLLAANFLRSTDGTLWLLDWEYAGMNDRMFDLGNLATNNAFDASAEEMLLEAYFGAVTRRRQARLRLMKIISDAREAMWAVVQQGISTLDFDYVAYAREHFDRLLAAANAPGYRALLEAAAEPEERA